MENGLFEHPTVPKEKRTIDSVCGSRLLGTLISVRIPEQSNQYESQFSTSDSELRYVADYHSIDNRIHLPHGTLLELLTEYSRIKWHKTTLICRLEDIIFHASLDIMANEPFVLQTQVKLALLSETTDYVCVSSKGSDNMLTSHLTGVVRNIREYECTPFVDLVQLKEKLNHRIVDKNEFYRSLESRTEVKYGPLLRAIDCAWIGEDECLCSVELGAIAGQAARVFQSALQALFCAAPTLKTIERIAEVNAVYLNHTSVFAHAKFDRNSCSGSVSILDKEGDTVCQLRGITGQMVQTKEDIVSSKEPLHTLSWEPKPLELCTDGCIMSLWVYVGPEVVGRILRKLSQTWTNNLPIQSLSNEHPIQIVSDLVSLIAKNSSINGVLFDLSTQISTEISLVQVKDTLDSISRILSQRRPQTIRALWVIMPFNEQTAPLSGWVQEMAMSSPWIRWKHLSVVNVGQLFAEIGCYQPTRADVVVVKYMEGKRYVQQQRSVNEIVQKTERPIVSSQSKCFKIINDHKRRTMYISLDEDVVQLENETAVIAFTESKQDWKTVWGRSAEGDDIIGVINQISSSYIDLTNQSSCAIGSEIDPINAIVFVEDYCCLQSTIFALKELKYNQRLRVFLSKAQLSILSHLASVKNLSLTVILELSEYFSGEINEALPMYMWRSENELKIAVEKGGADTVELHVQIPDRTVVQFVLLALSEGVYFARNDFRVLPIEDFNTAVDRRDTIVIKV